MKRYYREREMDGRMLAEIVAAVFSVLIGAGAASAAHPLVTDDTGTQGKGKTQLEFIGEYGTDKESGAVVKGFQIPTVPFLSYGLTDTIDIVFGLPYASIRIEDAGTTTAVRGVTDALVELKARLYEKDGLSFAVKPGISLPTGDDKKGLGNGKVSYSTFFITTKEIAPLAFHFNVGFIRNEYKQRTDEDDYRNDIWHVSIASQVEIMTNLNLVANIGMERNQDMTSGTHPAFILGGGIYSLGENIDLDFGVKAGLNETETDTTVLAGITWRL